jgi:hypothetical protein
VARLSWGKSTAHLDEVSLSLYGQLRDVKSVEMVVMMMKCGPPRVRVGSESWSSSTSPDTASPAPSARMIRATRLGLPTAAQN